MDTETEILCLGIVVGWLFTILSVAIVGMIVGLSEILLLSMLGISAGFIFGLSLIALLGIYSMNYKIVRRE